MEIVEIFYLYAEYDLGFGKSYEFSSNVFKTFKATPVSLELRISNISNGVHSHTHLTQILVAEGQIREKVVYVLEEIGMTVEEVTEDNDTNVVLLK